jgi:hypothetical protein
MILGMRSPLLGGLAFVDQDRRLASAFAPVVDVEASIVN